MTEPLSTVVVGCGAIGRTHVDAALRHPRLRLSGLVNRTAAPAEALAADVAAREESCPTAYTTLDEALESRPDLVVIATPSGLHVQQALAALRAGSHVLIEKPLDVDLARARSLADAVASTPGQVCSVVSQHRFDPAAGVVSDAITAERFGRVTSAVASVPWWRPQSYYDAAHWRGTWALDGGGALMNQGVHTLDLLLWFLGRPVRVSAETALLAHDGIEVEDIAVATIRFASGALAVLHATTAAYPGIGVRIHVMGSAGSAVIEDDRLEYFHTGADERSGARGVQLSTPARVPGVGGTRGAQKVDVLGHLRQYDDLIAAIDEHRRPLATVDEALLVLAAVRAVYTSAQLGHPVLIDDVLRG
ncbi:Gfo/Idh/MocA family oxidoreductase [Microbacterium protaetiae]|uniref:Gfo/Idh/MocA family oxidoreductase n=1 Tax=Microbacterium protaetiae TaxID=2509458 RepID=A0A4P6EDT8_9MICO|nr:Gfo/Idh/MocA family oxidoreductase [Microbacterium protaetiae]QAY59906.1 Gfo/Idh/MocA family oxidoreductase [Microbacterium protaetiae]